MGIQKDKFVIFQVDTGWIVYNTNKPFKDGHTHLKHKTSAFAAVDFILKGKIPKRTGMYYLVSLLRLSDDEIYIRKINELITVRKNKGKKVKYCRCTGYK